PHSHLGSRRRIPRNTPPGNSRGAQLVRGIEAARAGEVTTNRAPLNAIREGIPPCAQVLLRSALSFFVSSLSGNQSHFLVSRFLVEVKSPADASNVKGSRYYVNC